MPRRASTARNDANPHTIKSKPTTQEKNPPPNPLRKGGGIKTQKNQPQIQTTKKPKNQQQNTKTTKTHTLQKNKKIHRLPRIALKMQRSQ
ncbi:hypothetical protein [Helicobacter sp. T3_23-1056]